MSSASSAVDDFAWCRRQVETWKSYRPNITIESFGIEALALVVGLRMNGLRLVVKYTLTEIRAARMIGHPGNLYLKLEVARRAMEAPVRPQRDFPWLIPAAVPWVWDGAE